MLYVATTWAFTIMTMKRIYYAIDTFKMYKISTCGKM